VCARLLEEKWRQAYHAVFRFGMPPIYAWSLTSCSNTALLRASATVHGIPLSQNAGRGQPCTCLDPHCLPSQRKSVCCNTYVALICDNRFMPNIFDSFWQNVFFGHSRKWDRRSSFGSDCCQFNRSHASTTFFILHAETRFWPQGKKVEGPDMICPPFPVFCIKSTFFYNL
jgi:hypothetical protein